MTITAKVIADSIGGKSKRLTTHECRYPRFVHPEFMTHRTFCLAGNAVLDFDLPAGGGKGKSRRTHSMSLREFADKWINGAAAGKSSKHNGKMLDHISVDRVYTSNEIADELGMCSASNLNHLCKIKVVVGARKNGRVWEASGQCWMDWRGATGERRFDLKERLRSMRIRQVNEKTGEVQTSSIANCVVSGQKEVFRVSAGKFSVCGSADHRILTALGWKRISEIVPGEDQVVTYRYGCGEDADTNRYNKIDGHDVQGWREGVPLGTEAILVDKVVSEGDCDTYDLEIAGVFPNFFADGVVVHNSRNASSSRAVPVKKVIEDIMNDPAMPIHWGKNQPGMQANEELSPLDRERAKSIWLRGRDRAVEEAEALVAMQAHKQIVNRILEPYSHISVLVTATNFDNFYWLRRHPDAQPEIRALADAMWEARTASTPRLLQYGDWHLPYVTEEERCRIQVINAGHGNVGEEQFFDDEDLIKMSVARCARVSYLTHDGAKPDFAADMALYDRLVGGVPLHASPAEHQARPDTQVWDDYGMPIWENEHLSGNLDAGWIQFRKTLPGEYHREYAA